MPRACQEAPTHYMRNMRSVRDCKESAPIFLWERGGVREQRRVDGH